MCLSQDSWCKLDLSLTSELYQTFGYEYLATPTVPHPKLSLLLFWQKQKKPSPTFVHLRATLRVCQILLGKSCVLPTCEKICQVKRVYLQQFGIIHLPNPDLTYIRNLERETKLCFYPSISWKLKLEILRKNKDNFIPFHLIYYGRMRRELLRAYMHAWSRFFPT
jgi:hypothetical protein